ncbi:transposase [Synoicihabitans lomoniglobus]|nr:transposase [Opitutaceae bacterium LMO-M01]
MTRTVNGERLLDDVAREVLRKQLWQVADYCGLEVVTYAIMSNHFHVLVRVPQRADMSDAELLRRYAVLYPKPTRYQTAQLAVIKGQLAKGAPEGSAWRERQLALMGDLSGFMKLLKQRFSVWFNRSHGRYGTLWSERFKSVLVEGTSGVMRTIAAYIDLNPVRAGLVDDPKDYRFCGYAEAVAGNAVARRGISLLVEGGASHAWSWSHESYRQTLFGKGGKPVANTRSISTEAVARTMATRGRLPLASVLRCRIRYFSDGAVLGSREFVQKHLAVYRQQTGRRQRTAPRPLPQVTDWGELTTLRGLRRQTFG